MNSASTLGMKRSSYLNPETINYLNKTMGKAQFSTADEIPGFAISNHVMFQDIAGKKQKKKEDKKSKHTQRYKKRRRAKKTGTK
jgi:hypothetical protein